MRAPATPALGDLAPTRWPLAWGQSVVMLALLLPWVNPFAPFPSSAVVQSLLSVVGLALLLLLPLKRDGVAVLAQTNASVWLCAALLSCVLALIQYFGASAAWFPWVNGTAAGEAFANLRQRNQFATLTSIGLLALIWVQACGQPQARFQTQGRLPALAVSPAPAWAAAALLAVGNALSSSRTGLLQLLMMSALLLGCRSWRNAQALRLLLVAVMAYLAALLVMPWLAGFAFAESGMLSRLREIESSCQARSQLWRNVIYLIAQRPWAGWGWGELDYAHFITLYPGPRFCDILDNAHNLPLHLAVELGLPAALGICGLALYLMVRAQPWREADPTRQLAWGVLAVIGVHSLLEYPLWYGPFQLAFGVSLTLLWLTGSRFPAPPADVLATVYSGARGWLARAMVALGLVLATADVAMDYGRVRQFYLPLAERASLYRNDTLATTSRSGWFAHWVDFAELTTTMPDAYNAARLQAMAERLLHVSPEPRVIEKLIDTALLQQQAERAQFYLVRYQAAFPREHADWLRRHPG